jgi:microcompartment protein CcmK/EutM
MRIGTVEGSVTLNQSWETLTGGRLLLVRVHDRKSIVDGKVAPDAERIVVFDELGANVGETIAFSESREAAMPFYPERLVPLDAYNAAIIDSINL